MNQEPSPESLQLVLAEDEGVGRIVVDINAFFDFSFELAEDLQDLVALWQHRAAPRAVGRFQR